MVGRWGSLCDWLVDEVADGLVGFWRLEVGGWRLDTDIAVSVQGAGPPQGVIGDQRVQKTNGFP